jgi:hypothetical protein
MPHHEWRVTALASWRFVNLLKKVGGLSHFPMSGRPSLVPRKWTGRFLRLFSSPPGELFPDLRKQIFSSNPFLKNQLRRRKMTLSDAACVEAVLLIVYKLFSSNSSQSNTLRQARPPRCTGTSRSNYFLKNRPDSSGPSRHPRFGLPVVS